MQNGQRKSFFQYSLANLFVATVASAFFALLMRIYGVDMILPWATFFGLAFALFMIGQWLVTSVKEAAEIDPSTPKKLASFDTAYEADIFVARLSECGVQATATGGFVSGFQAESPGFVDVFVPATEFERAKLAIDELGL